jgi:hypothetical protein
MGDEKITPRILYRIRSKRHPRYGELCDRLATPQKTSDVQVRFEDGATEVVNSGILRVARETERWRQEK